MEETLRRGEKHPSIDLPPSAQPRETPIEFTVQAIDLHDPSKEGLTSLLKNIAVPLSASDSRAPKEPLAHDDAPAPETAANTETAGPAPEKSFFRIVETPPAPHLYTLAGVFTDTQLPIVRPHLQSLPGTKFHDLMQTTSSGTQSVSYKETASAPAPLCQIGAIVSPDGHTIDMNIQCPPDSIITSVTIWNNQTVAIAGNVEITDQGTRGRLIFITAKIKP